MKKRIDWKKVWRGFDRWWKAECKEAGCVDWPEQKEKIMELVEKEASVK